MKNENCKLKTKLQKTFLKTRYSRYACILYIYTVNFKEQFTKL